MGWGGDCLKTSAEIMKDFCSSNHPLKSGRARFWKLELHVKADNILKNNIWASAWQNLQNGMCSQGRFRSTWASTQSDQSLLCTQWVTKDPSFLYANSEDSDETGWMPRLIFAELSCNFDGFILIALVHFSYSSQKIVLDFSFKLYPLEIWPDKGDSLNPCHAE